MTLKLNNFCLCAGNCDRVLPLPEQHLNCMVILHSYFKSNFSGNIAFSTLACETCKNTRLTSSAFPTQCTQGQYYYLIFFHGNMQRKPHSPDSSKTSHEYNCPCHDCEIKYGSLPLLAEVIDDQEPLEIPTTTTLMTGTSRESSNKTENSTTNFSTEPSTSYSLQTDNSESAMNSRKEIPCMHCEKLFTHRGDFNKHLRTHTGEQPFSCHICKRKFAHTSNLNRHLNVHSGIRPFVCRVCNRSFSRKDKLEMHRKTKICKKYTQSPSL